MKLCGAGVKSCLCGPIETVSFTSMFALFGLVHFTLAQVRLATIQVVHTGAPWVKLARRGSVPESGVKLQRGGQGGAAVDEVRVSLLARVVTLDWLDEVVEALHVNVTVLKANTERSSVDDDFLEVQQ